MATVKEYLKRYGDKTFKELAMNEIDISIIAIISYADFLSSSVSKKYEKDQPIPLQVFNKDETLKLVARRYLAKNLVFYNFLKQFMDCKRYQDIELGNIENKFSEKNSVQFFAMTIKNSMGTFIIYRGTDNTIVGWKEDINLAISDSIPAQIDAEKYLEKIAKKVKGDLYIIGHSKGGNLAYYSFFNTKDTIKNRIKKVYNLDGPGFRDDNYDYDEYSTKLVKICPSDDVVGAIFDTRLDQVLVQSTRIGVDAHDMLTWKVDPHKKYLEFIHPKDYTQFCKSFKIALNDWFHNVPKESMTDFVDFIFTLVSIDNPSTLGDLKAGLFLNSRKYRKIIANFPPEKKKALTEMAVGFMRSWTYSFFHQKAYSIDSSKKELEKIIISLNKEAVKSKKGKLNVQEDL
ncbi:MAG: Mbeg1-like protein [Bacilli bacterium]